MTDAGNSKAWQFWNWGEWRLVAGASVILLGAMWLCMEHSRFWDWSRGAVWIVWGALLMIDKTGRLSAFPAWFALGYWSLGSYMTTGSKDALAVCGLMICCLVLFVAFHLMNRPTRDPID